MKTHCTIIDKYKSGLERDYAERLQILYLGKEIQWWAYEPFRLRIGNGALYTPDFGVLDDKGQMWAHETKGRWMEAAKVRIKVASSVHPWLRFMAITRVKEKWKFEEFG